MRSLYSVRSSACASGLLSVYRPLTLLFYPIVSVTSAVECTRPLLVVVEAPATFSFCRLDSHLLRVHARALHCVHTYIHYQFSHSCAYAWMSPWHSLHITQWGPWTTRLHRTLHKRNEIDALGFYRHLRLETRDEYHRWKFVKSKKTVNL